jgi:2',3'-cyclic-nucleotide 2'-phosphodiesterase (5'-nucleotidase family)
MYAEVDADYDAGAYEPSLRDYYADVIADGADIVIVLSHATPNSLDTLANDVADLGIELFLGGHAHVSSMYTTSNALIAATEPHSRQYAKVVLSIDNTTKTIVQKEGELVANIEGAAMPIASVQQVVDYWVNEINASEVLTYASTDVYDGTPESGIGNLVTDSFLDYFDWQHNFGVTNRGGGFRDYFRAGNITLGDVVSVVPFENNLLELTVTGSEIIQMLIDNHGYFTYSGIRYRFYNDPNTVIHSVQIFENDGFYALNPTKIYSGLMTDFNWWQIYYGMYSAVDTGVHYRDSVIEYFKTIDDISSYTYDDRILETDEELPGIKEFTQLNFFLISASIITMSIIFRKKIWKNH